MSKFQKTNNDSYWLFVKKDRQVDTNSSKTEKNVINRANSKRSIHPKVLQDLKLEVFQFSQKIMGLDVSEDIVSKLLNTSPHWEAWKRQRILTNLVKAKNIQQEVGTLLYCLLVKETSYR